MTPTRLAERDTEALLEARVCARLGRRVRGLQVLVQEAGVVLRGRAPTYYAKQLAQHALMAVSDLPIVANAIEVG